MKPRGQGRVKIGLDFYVVVFLCFVCGLTQPLVEGTAGESPRAKTWAESKKQTCWLPTKWGCPNGSSCFTCGRQFRVRLGLGYLGLTDLLVPGREINIPSGLEPGQNQEANLSDSNKVGLA